MLFRWPPEKVGLSGRACFRVIAGSPFIFPGETPAFPVGIDGSRQGPHAATKKNSRKFKEPIDASAP